MEIGARRFPRFAFTLEATAEVVRDIQADAAWTHRLESLGLGTSRSSGDLPGFHFECSTNGPTAEGTRLHAMWASGGGGIAAVVRDWNPEGRSFALDIVHTDDSCTWRTYEWCVKPLRANRCEESVKVRFWVPWRPLALLRCVVVLLPLKSGIAYSSLMGRY